MKIWKQIVISILIALGIEMALFNYSFFLCLGNKNVAIEDVGGYCISSDDTVAYAAVENIDIKCSTIYLDVDAIQADGQQSPVDVTIKLTDEGNAIEYELPTYRIFPGINRDKYITFHSYGNIHSIVVILTPQYQCNLQLKEAVLDSKIPFSFSIIRVTFLATFLFILSLCLPNSLLWKKEWTTTGKWFSTTAVILLNIVFLFILVRMGKAFLHPVWPYHAQYQNLARAILSGSLNIDAGNEDILAVLRTLDNPYDTINRMSIVPESSNLWDTAYFNGHLYVYFGVVPVLLYYIPFQLLLHRDMPTWFAVFVSASLSIPGAFYLMSVIRKRFFTTISHMWYLILSLILANSLNVMVCALHADFYYLPIVTALSLSLWGIGLILSTAYSDKDKFIISAIKYACGSLMIALTSGCRPQFLIGMFVVIAMLIPEYAGNKDKIKKSVKYIPFVIIPLVLVAVGMMIYNYARFGSPFDFGASYNLTTNDMTHRGFNLDRVKEGLFFYFVQPINQSIVFPFAQPVVQYSEYIGSRVSDWTFGGALFLLLLLVMC